MAFDSLPPDKRPKKPLPPPAERKPSSPIALPIEVQRSFFMTASKMLRTSSIAMRLNPEYQKMMRYDADIEGVLRSLQVSLAGMNWSVTSDDAKDQRLTEIAMKIKQTMRSAPRLTDMFRYLHEAIWYGCAAVNIIYERTDEGFGIAEWRPFHSDTLAFDAYGNLAMRVGSAYYNDGPNITDIGFDSRVHIFSDNERKAICLHRSFSVAPDFDDPWVTDRQYRGFGARDVAWFMWLAKQEVLQDALTFAERYAVGIRIGFYPLGNAEGRAVMENVLANLVNDNSVLLPKTGDDKLYDIEIKEPTSGGNLGTFMELLNWLSGKLKESIVGQNLSSESASTGMGSGVADLQGDTLSRISRFHADALADSLTREVIRPIAKMYGATDAEASKLFFRFSEERIDIKDRLEAIRAYMDMGGTVLDNEVRDMLGLGDPKPGEAVLGGKKDELPGQTGGVTKDKEPEQTEQPTATKTIGEVPTTVFSRRIRI